VSLISPAAVLGRHVAKNVWKFIRCLRTYIHTHMYDTYISYIPDFSPNNNRVCSRSWKYKIRRSVMKQKYGVELTYSIQMLHYLHYTNHIIMLCYF